MKITNSFLVINNYNNDLGWLKDYSSDYVIYNKGEPIDDKKSIQTPNVGYNIYDYLTYIIDNYDSLPDVVQFIKGNIMQRHITKEEYDAVCNNTTFTPLLTKKHTVDGHITYYDDSGLYHEKNTSWYLYSYEAKYYFSYSDFANDFGLPNTSYIPFAPGACYIVPKENILQHSKDYYERLRALVSWSQLPAEAHLLERSLYNIWKLEK